MVAMFTGLGAGAERGSGGVLGDAGMLWSGSLGRSGERVHVNAATGNLLVQQQDELLIGRSQFRGRAQLQQPGRPERREWRQLAPVD
jgi:hypothetical protein